MFCILAALWFRLLRRTYPWLPLCLQMGRIALVCQLPDRELVRFWRLLVQVDFAEFLAIAIELSQPEFWV
jgi:hypothetical protein